MIILSSFVRLLLIAVACFSAGLSLRGNEESEQRPRIVAHYMPWYASKPVSGAWGWHWTMDKFDPDTILDNELREAASHDYPLMGLYDSSDPDALECQVLQMKFAGIDGVIIDWYGTRDFYDYAMVHRSTEALIPFLEKAGLSFAICYEDQAIGRMVEGKSLEAEAAVGHSREVLKWVEENWFTRDSYLRHENRPVLITFGPQYFKPEAWREVTSVFTSNPWIHALPHLSAEFGADGPFGWPPVYGGKSFAPGQWKKSLQELYARADSGEEIIGVAFPGYEDIYEQAGLHEPYGYIDHRDGRTFSETLDLAFASQSELIQVATWNDYGEGTMIEPTEKRGYRYLEEIQRRMKPGFDADDLRLPLRLFELRKNSAEASEEEVNRISELLFAGEIELAKAAISKFKATQGGKNKEEDEYSYKTKTDVLYRLEENASAYMKERCRLDVYYPDGARDFATIVWFHGGGLSKGQREVPEPLKRQGVAVVAANYRLSPKVESPAYIEDAAAAVAWTFKHIETFGGARDKIFVSGHSAGGYLTSMVGFDKSYLKAHGVNADQIAGLIPFSGHTITHFTVRKERGIDGKQPVVDALAPLFHVRKDAPPTLLITGDREMELMGRYEENAFFWRMMQVVGHPDTELRELDGFDHGGMPEPAYPLLLEFVRKYSTAAVPNADGG